MTDKITPKQQEILDKIVTIADDFGAVRSYVTMETMLSYDLGLDSVDQVQLLMDIEREFNLSIPNDVQKSIQTIGDLVRFIEKETAQPATKVADKTVATKTQTDTKSKPDVQITITNVPNGKEKPTVLNCGTITDAQKQDFLAAISGHKPSDNDGDNHTCGFNVYYAKTKCHARGPVRGV
ncbi:MAG: acyl carrier protein, partial [Alphaproteobacteria bacterium]|nr:acyl carrier protein [Alphaproteobacteria bacterium]